MHTCAQVGSEVELLKVGDMVTVEMIWCGRCIPCHNGYPNHCTNLEELGFTIPGAFANYIEVDALSKATSVAYNATFERAGGFRPGHYVSVFLSTIITARYGLADTVDAIAKATE